MKKSEDKVLAITFAFLFYKYYDKSKKCKKEEK